MIGINPHTGSTIGGVSQLIMRIDRLFRTVKTTRPKFRGYGTTLQDKLGKNNSRIIITGIQNELLTELKDPANGVTDFKVDQVKLMPDGNIFLIGVFNGERTEFNV